MVINLLASYMVLVITASLLIALDIYQNEDR